MKFHHSYFLQGGELLERIQSKNVYNEDEARALTTILVTTVEHLHARNVVHRDIKVTAQFNALLFVAHCALPPKAGKHFIVVA